MILNASRRPFTGSIWTLVSLIAAGCASSAPSRDSEPNPADESGLSLIVVDQSGVTSVATLRDARREIEPGVRFAGLYIPGAANHDVVVSLGSGTSTQLAFLSSDGSFRKIDEREGNGDYTAAWSSDGSLAFGYGGARDRGVGIVGADGAVTDVGCSASGRALGWASSKKLIVGDESNHYVVAANGCATLSRVDARKMHETAFNPAGPTVAYVLRELEYDRKARQYVPDSSLFVAGVDGSDPRLVAGDRYKPHRPSWSPGGVELAFDARLPDHPERRLISIYDSEGGASSFLNAAAVERPVSEWDAHWSPDGNNIAYTQRTADGDALVAVRPINGSFVTPVGESGERFARWIDDSHLVVKNGKRERVVSTDGKMSVAAREGATILQFE